jgi:subtilisin family serine protease
MNRFVRWPSLFIAIAAIGCSGGDTTEPVIQPTALEPTSTATLSGVVGAAVSPSPSVRVVGSNQLPLAGTSVTFNTSGGGTVYGGTVISDANGVATVGAWFLGTAPGSQTLTATVTGLQSVTFTATAAVGQASRIAIVSGNTQTGDVGVPLPTPLSVRASDAFGNGVANVAVNFALTTGSGTIGSATATTNAEGVASTSLTLTGPGVTLVTASSSAISGSSAVFSANTGPTIAGDVSFAADVSRVLARSIGANTTLGRTAPAATRRRNFATKPRSVPTPESPEIVASPNHRIDTSRNLVVSFHKSAFSLPQDGRAYLSEGLREQASAQFYSALSTLESSGMIHRREVSPAIAAVRVDVPADQDVEEVKRLLRQDPRVLAVEENVLVHAHSYRRVVPPAPVAKWSRREPIHRMLAAAASPATEVYPSDPQFANQLWHYRMIDLPRAWKLTTGNPAVRVAIVDSGIRPDHPGIGPLLAASGHFDFTDGVTTAFSFPQPICGTGQTFLTVRGTSADLAMARNLPQHPNDLILVGDNPTCWTRNTSGSHGTHVAGTVGSRANDGIGGTGVNWNVELIAVRALGVTGSGFSFDIAQAILYAGGLPATFTGAQFGTTVQMPAAHVMNLSLGGSTPTTVQQNAIAAAAANTLIIASAGNNGNSAANYPAAYPEPVSVVALAPDGDLSTYTTVGTSVDISAPGGDTRRFWPSAGVLSTTWNFQTNAPNYSFFQGTSMAAPHVTGVAALVFAANPGLSPAQVRARLVNGAVDLFAPGHDNRSGAGLVNAYNAITGTRGPATKTVVSAIDASTGLVRKTATAGANGSFAIGNLTPGSYFVVAGQDEGTDASLGIPGRRFGWYGSSSMSSVNVSGASTQSISVRLGSPVESEPNDAPAQANPIVVNSWVSGHLLAPDARDVYVVRIPTAGTYTFETSGIIGACFSSLEVDTVLRLTDVNGSTVGSNDDTSFPTASYPGQFCSLVTVQLQPGTYYVEVTSADNDFGAYRLHVRTGN